MKKQVLVLLLSAFSVCALYGQETTSAYLSSSAVIANPERGWYDHHDTNALEWYSSLDAADLIKNREGSQITLIMRMFYLKDFIETEAVSAAYIEKMQGDFDAARAAGIKCIVRFAYSKSQSAEKWDATPDKVLSHIESMSTVLSSNADVIAAVQAGFVGAWGEWYYTKNFAGTGYNPSAEDQDNRRQLVEALLNVLPEHVQVQGRTPAIMKNIVQSDASISDAEAYSGSVKSRVGHHNDCFLANRTDYGTYGNVDDDVAYLAQTTKYAIAGGETCDDSNAYSDCANALDKMKALHWTYLNRDYNKNVYNKWETQGCYDEINIALGYRLQLKTSTVEESVAPGAQLKLSFYLANVGYAAPTQYKPIQLVLTHNETAQKLVLDYEGSNDDVRYWLPGDILLEGYVEVPNSVNDGNYTISLKFPDQDSLLAQNPAYSIQLANVGVWNAEFGVNHLQHVVAVGTGGLGSLPDVPASFSVQYFSKSEMELSWIADLQDGIGYEIMRSVDNDQDWVLIAELAPEEHVYRDTDLDEGVKYSYIIRSKNTYGSSAWSSVESANSSALSGPTFDGFSFSVYPNPWSGGNLNVNFGSEATRQIIICNMSGQLVYDQTIFSGEIQLDYSLFKPGVYQMRVVQDKVCSRSRIIVY